MRAVVQRVSEASVTIDGTKVAEIKCGLVILIGIEHADTTEDVVWLASKIVNLRIFNDDAGVMNLAVKDVAGDVIIVSQFTLHAATKKGNRPSYIKASKPPIAMPLYNRFITETTKELDKDVYTGRFGADMKVALINDGPVTIIIDTKNKE